MFSTLFLLTIWVAPSSELQTWTEQFFDESEIISEYTLGVYQQDKFVPMEAVYPLGAFGADINEDRLISEIKQVVFQNDQISTLFTGVHESVNKGRRSIFYWGKSQPLTLVLQLDDSSAPGLVSLVDLERAKGDALSPKEIKMLEKGKFRLDFDSQGSGAIIRFPNGFYHVNLKTGSVRHVNFSEIGNVRMASNHMVYQCNVMASNGGMYVVGSDGQFTEMYTFKGKGTVANLFGKKQRFGSMNKLTRVFDNVLKSYGPKAGELISIDGWLFDRKGHILTSPLKPGAVCGFAVNAPIIAAVQEKKVAVFDSDARKVIKTFTIPEAAFEVIMGSDGKYMVLATAKRYDVPDKDRYLYNLTSGGIVEEIPMQMRSIYMVTGNRVLGKMKGKAQEIVVLNSNSERAVFKYDMNPFILGVDRENRSAINYRAGVNPLINSIYQNGRRVHFREAQYRQPQ